MKRLFILLTLFQLSQNIQAMTGMAQQWISKTNPSPNDLWIPFLHSDTALYYLGQTFAAEGVENIGMIFERNLNLTVKELKELICQRHPSNIYDPNDILILDNSKKAFESEKDIRERTLNDSSKIYPSYNSRPVLVALNINKAKSNWMQIVQAQRQAQQRREAERKQQQEELKRRQEEEQKLNTEFAKIEKSVLAGGPSCVIQ